MISLASAKVIRTGWRVRARARARMLIAPGDGDSDATCVRATGRTNVIELISRSSKIAECTIARGVERGGLTHAYSFGTCLVLPPPCMCLSKLLFLLGDRLNARHRIYRGPRHTYVNAWRTRAYLRNTRSASISLRILLCRIPRSDGARSRADVLRRRSAGYIALVVWQSSRCLCAQLFTLLLQLAFRFYERLSKMTLRPKDVFLSKRLVTR